MAVTIEASGIHIATDASSTDVSIAVASAGDNRLAILAVGERNETYSTPQYGGENMTLLDTDFIIATNTATFAEVWYLANPALGANNFTFRNSNTGGVVAFGSVLSGVNQSTPFGTPVSTNSTFGSTNAAGLEVNNTASGEEGGLFLDFSFAVNGVTSNWTVAIGSDQVLVLKAEGVASASQIGGAYSYAPGAGSATLKDNYNPTSGPMYVAAFAVPVLPAAVSRDRAVRYFYDVYSGNILSAAGTIVRPWQVEPDNWIRVSGFLAPSGRKYASFAQDPELAYIEEVSYSAGGLSIITNRGELTEVLLARAAGGKTL